MSSKTDRITSILAATAVAIVVAFVACPGHHRSKPTQASLLSVEVTPTNPTIALGTEQQFTATGTYSDGTTLDLTALADWTSSDAAASDVSMADDSRGKATALGMGSTTITATYSGTSGSTTLTISSAALVTIEVTPTNLELALGTSGQFAATGIFTDGSTQDLTAQVQWESSATGASTISNDVGSNGLAQSVGLGATTISATLSGVSGSANLTVTNAALVSIEVTPTNPSIALGTSGQFAATGIFTDGSTQDLTAQVQWESSATGTSTISNDAGDPGFAQSVGMGDTTITATLSGVSGSTTLTVTNAVLVSLEVTPTNASIALGTSQQFVAMGTFSDGTVQDLTAEVLWESSDATAQVSNAADSQGLAESVSVGSTTISATHSGHAGSTTLTISNAALVSIAVTPALPVIALGTTQAFTATGTYTDGSTQDLTAEVLWSSSNESVSTVANSAIDKGVASSVTMGSATISAELSGISGSTDLAVSSPLLVSLEVTPGHPSAALGTTQSFVATGIYTDGSMQDVTGEVTWTTSDPAVATVSNADGSRGLATTVAVGSTTIAASLDGQSGSTSFAVSAADLLAIAVSPDVATLAAGTSQTFSALGLFSDGTRQDLSSQVTWSSSDDSIATVSGAAGSQGLVTSLTVGNVTISASFSAVSGSAAVEVSSATLVSIDIIPFVPSIAKGTKVQFLALGNFTDGSTQDLTSQVTWSTSGDGIAVVSNAAGSHGLGTGVDVGTATITATFSGVEETVDLGVTAALLVSIQLTPADPTVPIGLTVTVQATGVFSDTATQDLTDFVTWSSSNAAVATISNASGSHGLAKGVSSGTAQLTATLLGVSTSTTLTVTAATLLSISVSPVGPTVPAGYSLALQAVGNFSDGSDRSMTSEVLWSSSTPSVATISNSAGTEGHVTGLVTGTTTLSATLPGKTGTTFLTVTSEVLDSIELEPASVALVVGETRQMTAMGLFSGGSVVDLTSLVKWQVTPRSVATVSNYGTTKGLVTARKSGNTTIRATKENKLGTASLSVTKP